MKKAKKQFCQSAPELRIARNDEGGSLRRWPRGSLAQYGFGPEAFGGFGNLHIFQEYYCISPALARKYQQLLDFIVNWPDVQFTLGRLFES